MKILFFKMFMGSVKVVQSKASLWKAIVSYHGPTTYVQRVLSGPPGV